MINLQVNLKKLEYHEKGQNYLSLISESEIFQAFISY